MAAVKGDKKANWQETAVSQITSEAIIKFKKIYMLTPTFVGARHPFQVFREGRLSTNQVGEYANLRKEDRSCQ